MTSRVVHPKDKMKIGNKALKEIKKLLEENINAESAKKAAYKKLGKPGAETNYKVPEIPSWKQTLSPGAAIDYELSLIESTLSSFSSPYEALNFLINWHIEVDRWFREQEITNISEANIPREGNEND